MRYKEEVTDWGSENIPNHIYVTEGRVLLGYVPRGTTVVQWFNEPKKQWSTTHRRFRELSKREVSALS